MWRFALSLLAARHSLDVRPTLITDKPTIQYFGYIYAVTFLAGIFVFVVAGGIAGLASDVGLSGAWIVLGIFHLLYGTLFIIGFLLFKYAFNNINNVHLKLPLILICVAISSGAINLYGIHLDGPGLHFMVFSLIVILAITIMYALATFAYSSLTNHSTRTR